MPGCATIGVMSEVVPADEQAVERVVETLRKGQLAVVPTDSVYGVVADAFSALGTQRLFAAKRRDRRLPLPVLIRSPRQTTGLVEELSEAAERLMAAYWPGPLTLVCRAAEGLTWDLGELGGALSLRMPSHDLLLDVVKEVGPVACTAANRAGEPPPTTLDDARAQMGGAAALYVDAGTCDGPRSTVVDVTRAGAQVLAEGAIAAAHVAAVAEGRVGWGLRPTDADVATTETDQPPTPAGGAPPHEGVAEEGTT